MRPYGTVWDRMGPYGTVWDRMGPYGTVWDRNLGPMRRMGPMSRRSAPRRASAALEPARMRLGTCRRSACAAHKSHLWWSGPSPPGHGTLCRTHGTWRDLCPGGAAAKDPRSTCNVCSLGVASARERLIGPISPMGRIRSHVPAGYPLPAKLLPALPRAPWSRGERVRNGSGESHRSHKSHVPAGYPPPPPLAPDRLTS